MWLIINSFKLRGCYIICIYIWVGASVYGINNDDCLMTIILCFSMSLYSLGLDLKNLNDGKVPTDLPALAIWFLNLYISRMDK